MTDKLGMEVAKATVALMGRVSALEAVAFQPQPPMPRRKLIVRDLVTQAAAAHGVSVADIYGPSRKQYICLARWWVMYEAHKAGLSLSQIGRELHRDHTTILHGVRREAELRGLATPGKLG